MTQSILKNKATDPYWSTAARQPSQAHRMPHRLGLGDGGWAAHLISGLPRDLSQYQ